MPIYEYRCQECGIRYEKLVPSVGAPAPGCPSCHSSKVEKLLSVPSIGKGASGSPAGGLGPCGSPKSSCGSGGFS